MTEQIASFWHVITETLGAKLINYFAIPTMIIVSAESSKPQQFINLADYGLFSLSIPTWMQIIGSVWILTLLLEKWGVFKFIRWAFKKVFDRESI